MTRLHHIIFIALLLMSGLSVRAQDNTMRQVYAQASDNYQVGRIDEAMTLLQSNIDGFHGTLKQSAFRLMALCCLGQDNDADAEKYAGLLLKEAPYYSPSAQDPVRFIDLINKIKSGNTATITTASNQAESMEEVPVPVTLIDEEMIRMSGARNLKELLVIFVPGMSNVETNEELNVAMRGIYSTGQETILIMLNGHRLNSYSTNVARPDFAISLEKIKQIEVLRGPASSLYGGVALTAVINIITKSGIDIDGCHVKGGVGNYGQWQGDFLFGQHYLDLDVAAWANIYNADGQKFYIREEELENSASPMSGDIIVGGFNKKPSHDFGLNVTWKSLSLMYSNSFSKTVAPYALSYFFAPYEYDKYGIMDGNAPGYANTAHHARAIFKNKVGRLNYDFSVTYDREYQNRYQVVTDYFSDLVLYSLKLNGADVEVFPKDYTFQYNSWQEQNMGISANGDHPYSFGDAHNGMLSFGAQYNRFELSNSRNLEGDKGNRVLVEFWGIKNLFPGVENSADAYLQLKHKWKWFILNAGVRYDYKKRNNNKGYHELSPRVAFVYANPLYNMKLSYSRAFVDAPYYYRYNTLDTYSGGEDLLPEYLNSIQFTCSSNKLLTGLDVELNAFYNKASNLIVPEGIQYTNSGVLRSMGLEFAGKYTNGRLLTTMNAEWQHVISSENYTANGSIVYNVPEFSANLMSSYQLLDGLRLHGTLKFQGKQYWLLQYAPELEWPSEERSLPARAVLDLGANYKYKSLELIFNCHNVFNTNYVQGGSSIAPIAQQGRWIMGQVAYYF